MVTVDALHVPPVRPIHSWARTGLDVSLVQQFGGSTERGLEWVPRRPWRGGGAEFVHEPIFAALEAADPTQGYAPFQPWFAEHHNELGPAALGYALHLVVEKGELAPPDLGTAWEPGCRDLAIWASEHPSGNALAEGVYARMLRLASVASDASPADPIAAALEAATSLVREGDELRGEGDQAAARERYEKASDLLEELGAVDPARGGGRDHPLNELHQWILRERIVPSMISQPTADRLPDKKRGLSRFFRG